MRLILYALGRKFERYRNQIDWRNVVAVSDRDAATAKDGYPAPFVDAKNIAKLKYDFVVIFSDLIFENVRMYLAWECGIPVDKIISWRGLFPEYNNAIRCILRWLSSEAGEWRQKKILDSGLSGIEEWCLTKKDIAEKNSITLYRLDTGIEDVNAALYDGVCGWEEIGEHHFGYVLMGDIEKFETMDAWTERIKELSTKAGHLVFSSSYEQELRNSGIGEYLSQFGAVERFSAAEGRIWIVSSASETDSEPDSDISVYVVTHRAYPLMNRKPYVPLCVGGYSTPEYVSESQGDNISYLNPKLDECTAMYWIWKNTASKYVGLNHYRRYFYRNDNLTMENFLRGRDIESLLVNYDIILPKTWLTELSIEEDLKKVVGRELYEKAHRILRECIWRHQRPYVDKFDKIMRGHATYYCNMFIAKREIFDEYCKWLFSFIIEAADSVDVNGYDSNSQRIIGFFVERLLTVWLWDKHFRIKQLPIVTPHW